MAEVGSAFVTLVPSAKGFGKATSSQIEGQLEGAGKKGGSKLTSAFGSIFKKGGVAVAAAGAVAIGAALTKGFARLSAIDQARAKLEGLGNSTKQVDQIMDDALASVKGTAFGLGDAATVAASAVAAGIKPGKDLQRTLSLTGDAATIAGVSISEMGAIFNKVATANKIQGDVINQLNDAGIPIIQLLGKELGKTSAEVTDMASKGKIDFKTFQDAMEAGLGGAAQKSGNTFQGAFANMGAALGRFGAALLTGVFPIAKDVFGGITGFLDDMTAKVGPVADSVAEKLPGAFRSVKDAIKNLVSDGGGPLKPLIDAFDDFATHVKSAADKVGPAIKTLADDIAPVAKAIGKAALGAAITALKDALKLLGPVVDGLATAFADLADAIDSNQTGFTVLAIIIGTAYLPVLIQSTVALIANAIATTTAGIAAAAYGIYCGVVSQAVRIWTASQWLLNAALAANPIVLVVVAIAALVAGLILAWQHSERFRAIVTGAFDAVKAAGAAVLDFFRSNWPLIVGILTGPIGIAAGLIIKFWDQIKSATSAAWTAVKDATTTAWGAVRDAVTDAVNTVKSAVTGAWSSVRDATTSAWNTVRTTVSSVMTSVKSAVSNGVHDVVGFFKKLPGDIKGALSGAASALYDVGARMVQGLVNGIKGAAGAVVDAAKGVVSGAINGAKSLLGIHSPSRVFLEIGQQTGAGFVLGMAGMERQVSRGGASLALASIPSLDRRSLVGPSLATVGPVAAVPGRAAAADLDGLRVVIVDNGAMANEFAGRIYADQARRL